ncbi:phosphatidylserine decarboxylase [Sorangium cellulosum]|uniref:phosphatidylserine decarboxylase n=1 Tax=Sorangium cellulosum TaxID=56 RepID=A0A4P2QEI5_SORCE|nr:archaetidylserine decarboxylase [Sorangium cellulosum]AUX27593.1 phosphatidylserine decarboxylase [Sorangium cellulosum]
MNAVVKLYARAYRVDMDAAEPLTCPYESFDAFFTRQLRPGVRPVCSDPGAITSPADGRIEAIGPVTEGGRLFIKGQPYRVEDLVGDPAEAARYDGGQFAVVYLSPRDYHRVHAPVAGQVSLIRSMPGELFPVNAIGERHVPGLFARNRRVAIVIDTERQGRVTVVMVGAMIVGRITVSAVEARDVPLGVHTITPALPVRCGEEIGKFHLGSTTVMFVERGAAPPWTRAPGPILYGEPLGGGVTA